MVGLTDFTALFTVFFGHFLRVLQCRVQKASLVTSQQLQPGSSACADHSRKILPVCSYLGLLQPAIWVQFVGQLFFLQYSGVEGMFSAS